MNWKTTIGGILIALTVMDTTIKAGAKLEDWRTWILPVLIAVFGFFTKDANKQPPEQ